MFRSFVKSVIIVWTAWFGLAFANPTYLVQPTNTKGVIKTPHYHEYDSVENPDGNYWCGHTALKSALGSFGIYKRLDSLHESFIKIDKTNPSYYDYNEKGPCPWCVHIKLLEKYVNNLSNMKAVYKSSYSADAYYSDVKNAIQNGKVVVSLSGSWYNGRSWNHQIGHYFTVHGYREVNGQKYLYLRDPVLKNGGQHTDWHEITLQELWRNMRKGGRIQSIIISRR